MKTLTIFIFLILIFLLDLSVFKIEASSPEKYSGSHALFIFGDSTVDAGNNNYIGTIPGHKANFPPYGMNGFFGGPTGRFTDGRTIADFIAEYAGIPIVPPILQPSANFSNGANFASGGAGILIETNPGWAISLDMQVRQFGELQASMRIEMGDAKAREVISEAVYLISIGSNDYLTGYSFSSQMQKAYPVDEYVGMVVGNLTHAIQDLYEKGARKFCFLSLSPLGCLPVTRALMKSNNGPDGDGACFDEISELALAHNSALSATLVGLEYILKGFKYVNPNVYEWINDRINHPSKYGFKDGVNACCGIGPYRGIYSCGGTRETKEYLVCESPEVHVWWDSVHLSEKVHQQSALELWNGSPSSHAPYNLKDFFFTNEKYMIIDDVVVDDEKDELGFGSLY